MHLLGHFYTFTTLDLTDKGVSYKLLQDYCDDASKCNSLYIVLQCVNSMLYMNRTHPFFQSVHVGSLHSVSLVKSDLSVILDRCCDWFKV